MRVIVNMNVVHKVKREQEQQEPVGWVLSLSDFGTQNGSKYM